MAPLRNRSHRVQNDQDQMIEGLPIRNWRRIQSNIGAPAEEHAIVTHSRWPELPMPRDSPLLSDLSRQLLRIARLPKVSKPAPSTEDDDKENGEEEEKSNKSEDRKGFLIRKWSQMSKDWSGSDREFLAKRRKGLPTQEGYNMLYGPLGVSRAFRKLKVRRYDADGFPHIYEVMAPVGMPVEGEIVEDAQAAPVPVEPPAAPGTIIEGVGVVNEQGIVVAQATPTQNRRKPPPPPRKKKKGPFGKHSKKKIVTEYGPDGLPIHPPGPSDGMTPAEGTEQGDTPMPDAHDDDVESGEEGEEMEEDDDDHEEGEISSSGTPARSQSAEVSVAAPVDPAPAVLTPTYNPSSLRSEVKFELEVSAPSEDPLTVAPLDYDVVDAVSQEAVMNTSSQAQDYPDLGLDNPVSESNTHAVANEESVPLFDEEPTTRDTLQSQLSQFDESLQQYGASAISSGPAEFLEEAPVQDTLATSIPLLSIEEPTSSELGPPVADEVIPALEEPALGEAAVATAKTIPASTPPATLERQEIKEIAETMDTSEPVQTDILETVKPAEPADSIQPEPIEWAEDVESVRPAEIEEPAEPEVPSTYEALPENDAPEDKVEVLEESLKPVESTGPIVDTSAEDQVLPDADSEVPQPAEADALKKDGEVVKEELMVDAESNEPMEINSGE